MHFGLGQGVAILGIVASHSCAYWVIGELYGRELIVHKFGFDM